MTIATPRTTHDFTRLEDVHADGGAAGREQLGDERVAPGGGEIGGESRAAALERQHVLQRPRLLPLLRAPLDQLQRSEVSSHNLAHPWCIKDKHNRGVEVFVRAGILIKTKSE